MPDGFTTLTVSGMDTATAYRLLCGIVVPRPIAWISTVSVDGVVNLAPFSSYAAPICLLASQSAAATVSAPTAFIAFASCNATTET